MSEGTPTSGLTAPWVTALAAGETFSEALEAAQALRGRDRGQLAAFLGVSPRAAARRGRTGTWQEGERLRLEMAYRLAREAGRRLGGPLRGPPWLAAPNRALGSRTPLSLLDSVAGYERARDALTIEGVGEAGRLSGLAARLGIPAEHLAAAIGPGDRPPGRRGRAGRPEPGEAAGLERAERLFGRCAEVARLLEEIDLGSFT